MLDTRFRSNRNVRHNARRLEHLASLRLNLSGRGVLDMGAEISDHTPFSLDRGCSVAAVEGHEENIHVETLRVGLPTIRDRW